ncbi:MAG: hypothetical protein DRJ45_05465, partial [Thermoprotei archaeon]
MSYSSNSPQTDISIFKFYQNIGYKYRNWIPELNKYSEIIPTVNIAGEDVPRNLISNASIKSEQSGIIGYQCVLREVESLILRQVLETLSTAWFITQDTKITAFFNRVQPQPDLPDPDNACLSEWSENDPDSQYQYWDGNNPYFPSSYRDYFTKKVFNRSQKRSLGVNFSDYYDWAIDSRGLYGNRIKLFQIKLIKSSNFLPLDETLRVAGAACKYLGEFW